MNTPLKLAAVVAGLAFGLTTASAQAVATYAVVDLGVLPGDSTSSPWAINSQGDVVGTSTASLAHQVFVYRDGVGLTAVPMPPGVTRAFGRGINDFGQVAMQTSFGPCTGVPGDAWLWTPGVGHSNLGALAGGTADPTSVNNAGMVVGVGEVSSCSRAAFLHDGTGMSVVTAGVAGQINDAGMIAGTGANGAFRYQAGTVTWLGALPNLPVSRGQAIDGQGRVCGVSLTNNGHVCHMFVDAPGVGMTDLGLVGKRSAVRGMASNGAAVGHWDNDLGTEYGFVWTDATGIVDLNTRLQDPSWVILDAFAINDNGQIAAFGFQGFGSVRALRLDPLPSATVAAVGTGCAGLALTASSPVLGTTLQLGMTQTPPGAVAVLALANGAAITSPWQPGCDLHVNPANGMVTITAFADPNGAAGWQLNLPASPTFAGVMLTGQAAHITTALPLTNAIQLTLGF